MWWPSSIGVDMSIIIYTQSCLACKSKTAWKKVKEFAKANNLTIEERRVTKRQEWKEQAEQIGVHMPFVQLNGVSLNVNEDLEKLL